MLQAMTVPHECRNLTSDMVWIPGGTFRMGSDHPLCGRSASPSRDGRRLLNQATPRFTALVFCIAGLLGVFAVGYPGYFVFNSIWPNFYYLPNIAGKNVWLLGQTAFFALYWVGMLLAFNDLRHVLTRVEASPT
jgi:hypothetical protein